jgi:hypothetical protein
LRIKSVSEPVLFADCTVVTISSRNLKISVQWQL